ncbi:hypothetical protein AVEN_144263-1 [Araneus ventricosus]|uniref:Uncharacterized protein n=1 Tax=Araneus ventricosus TaxID=182803 RepID=A0A4Y2QLQ9_ARAVE|nr:hypothetical protein AVEN_144263-1 [Araneus ventricosus]
METFMSNTKTNDQVIKIAGNNIALTVLPNKANASSFHIGGALETWDSNVTTLFNDSDVDSDQRLKQLETSEAAVLLPANLLTKNWNDNVTNTAIIIHRDYYNSKREEVISPVIGVVLGDAPVYKLDPPVKMVFKVPEVNFDSFLHSVLSWFLEFLDI